MPRHAAFITREPAADLTKADPRIRLRRSPKAFHSSTTRLITRTPLLPTVDPDGLRKIEVYDPATDAWAVKATMPTARNWPASAAVNGKIYAIGGDSTFLSNPLRSVEEYNPATDTWAQRANMPTARLALAAAVVGGKIYAIGGLTTSGSMLLSTVEVYDPVANTWERKAPMPTPRGMLCASVLDGKIYTFGSLLGPSGPSLPTVEMYDTVTDTWTRKANMPTARGALASSVVNGKIYVMGGRTASISLATVEEYDPATDSWRKLADMGLPTSNTSSRSFGRGAGAVNGRIYAIGGGSNIVSRQGLSLVLEYTPPITAPAAQLRVKTVMRDGKNFIQLEWPSRSDAIDLLQNQQNLQPDGWIDVEAFSGTGETLTRDLPALEPTAFYRLRRSLR